MLSHGNLAHNARTLHEYWHFQPGDVLLHMLPTFHVHGLFVACHTRCSTVRRCSSSRSSMPRAP
jgi:long-subunit acyl-CoA synthetase (AMP-forming)